MELFYQLSAVALVLGLMGAALWALRRRGLISSSGIVRSRGIPGRLEPLARLALTPQHTLHLVRLADRALLIGAHSAGCTLLDSVPLAAVETLEGAPK
ncbi:MAG TPA: flagellar biosynthetic protein FliO [Bryobacteraceae bacterium]|nr:flagellar biosynthetic protein FliO [Bryobacteraceae bacterium]HOL69969.1 flagellar biosynthetic protein FliO [Bryobacteraceae bacterium]HOQ44194.1 flagellar biosynthetic protein FliO [Bryobacteraceae bacterium]HPQ14665.1 flagellar biosynthetic protein FliO [Bryobacteraceae bacterium]HPU70512.1 flagellar biosynthetic protein FliO [Bryobacteraceae bacterium]